MFRLAAFFGIIGLAAATFIIARSGYDQVLLALSQAGWGILWTSLFHIVPMICCVIGWHMLMPPRHRPGYGFFMYVLWLRAAANNLLPVARIGGEVLAVRVMIKYGIRSSRAVASTVVETTMSVISVFFFNIIGIAMFVLHVGDRNVSWELALGLLMSLPVIGGFLLVQRMGFFGMLSRMFALMFRDKWAKYAGGAGRLDRAVHAMYRRRWHVVGCGFWNFASWLLGSVEIWMALRFLAHPLPPSQALMIEALIQASSSAAFIVPGALGVQEAGFLVFGHMLGLTADVAVAMAVMRRCRDLLIYLPALIVWQIQESKWLLKTRALKL